MKAGFLDASAAPSSAAGEEVVPFRYVAESGQLTFDLGRSTTALRVEWS